MNRSKVTAFVEQICNAFFVRWTDTQYCPSIEWRIADGKNKLLEIDGGHIVLWK